MARPDGHVQLVGGHIAHRVADAPDGRSRLCLRAVSPSRGIGGPLEILPRGLRGRLGQHRQRLHGRGDVLGVGQRDRRPPRPGGDQRVRRRLRDLGAQRDADGEGRHRRPAQGLREDRMPRRALRSRLRPLLGAGLGLPRPPRGLRRGGREGARAPRALHRARNRRHPTPRPFDLGVAREVQERRAARLGGRERLPPRNSAPGYSSAGSPRRPSSPPWRPGPRRKSRRPARRPTTRTAPPCSRSARERPPSSRPCPRRAPRAKSCAGRRSSSRI